MKNKEEGHYTIKKVDKLPKKLNSNYLYTTNFQTYARRKNNGSTEEVEMGVRNETTTPFLEDSLTTTITGSGIETDPFKIESTPDSFTALLEFDGTDWIVTSDDIDPNNIEVSNVGNTLTIDHPNINIDTIGTTTLDIIASAAVLVTKTLVTPIKAVLIHTALTPVVGAYNIVAGYKAYYTRKGRYTTT